MLSSWAHLASVWSMPGPSPNKADAPRPHYSYLNDLDRVTGYNYVPTDGARYPPQLFLDKITFLVDIRGQMTY